MHLVRLTSELVRLFRKEPYAHEYHYECANEDGNDVSSMNWVKGGKQAGQARLTRLDFDAFKSFNFSQQVM